MDIRLSDADVCRRSRVKCRTTRTSSDTATVNLLMMTY